MMFTTLIARTAAITAALVIGFGAASAETTQEKGLRIASQVGQEPGFRDQAAEGEMILTTRNGQTSTRRFEARSVETGPDEGRSVLTFLWPGDISNTALLTHSHAGGRDDDQWLYLPAVSKVRRITSSGRSGSFVGSEFAYEDMVDQDIDKYDFNWVQAGACPSGGTCDVIDRFPRWLVCLQLRAGLDRPVPSPDPENRVLRPSPGPSEDHGHVRLPPASGQVLARLEDGDVEPSDRQGDDADLGQLPVQPGREPQ